MELTGVGEKNLEYFLPFLGDEVRPEWGIIGAVEDDSAIGAIAFELRDNMAIMKSLFVDEDYRKQYVGTSLISHIKENYPDTALMLHAEIDDTPKDMYLKMGFEIVDKLYEYSCQDIF